MTNEEHTLTVKPIERFSRTDYAPCNELAQKLAEHHSKKSFSRNDLIKLKRLGYLVKIQVSEVVNHTYIDFEETK